MEHLVVAGQRAQYRRAARRTGRVRIAAANPLTECIVAVVIGVHARELHALGQSCKLAARPGSTVAIDSRGAAHRIVAYGCAAARGQSVRISAVVGKRLRDRRARQRARRVRVLLDLTDPTVIIILVYKGFVKLYRIQ